MGSVDERMYNLCLGYKDEAESFQIGSDRISCINFMTKLKLDEKSIKMKARQNQNRQFEMINDFPAETLA